jgi:hypothetical protein
MRDRKRIVMKILNTTNRCDLTLFFRNLNPARTNKNSVMLVSNRKSGEMSANIPMDIFLKSMFLNVIRKGTEIAIVKTKRYVKNKWTFHVELPVFQELWH